MRRDLGKLSPQARKAAVGGAAGDVVRALVELAPGASPETLAVSPEALGAEVLSWSAATRLLTLAIAPDRLAELASDRSVTYVQVGGAMRR